MTLRAVAVLMAVMACAGGVARATDVTGNILTNTTWTVAGSPWVIKKDIRVRNGATLTIEPGATVAFDGYYRLETDIVAPVVGSIVAVGTYDNYITFTSNLPSPTVGSWNNVVVGDTLFSSVSAFRHCVFEYANEGLRLTKAARPIEHCFFRDCQTGIYLQYSSPSITGTSVVGCTVAGILCYGRSTVPRIRDCYLDNRQGAARNIYLTQYGQGVIVAVDATLNWWGTNVAGEIATSIHDRNDDLGIFGVVNYDPFYTEPAVETTSWGGIKAMFRN